MRLTKKQVATVLGLIEREIEDCPVGNSRVERGYMAELRDLRRSMARALNRARIRRK